MILASLRTMGLMFGGLQPITAVHEVLHSRQPEVRPIPYNITQIILQKPGGSTLEQQKFDQNELSLMKMLAKKMNKQQK